MERNTLTQQIANLSFIFLFVFYLIEYGFRRKKKDSFYYQVIDKGIATIPLLLFQFRPFPLFFFYFYFFQLKYYFNALKYG